MIASFCKTVCKIWENTFKSVGKIPHMWGKDIALSYILADGSVVKVQTLKKTIFKVWPV
jgi:hypothetical protein